jgi:hypothetical protein
VVREQGTGNREQGTDNPSGGVCVVGVGEFVFFVAGLAALAVFVLIFFVNRSTLHTRKGHHKPTSRDPPAIQPIPIHSHYLTKRTMISTRHHNIMYSCNVIFYKWCNVSKSEVTKDWKVEASTHGRGISQRVFSYRGTSETVMDEQLRQRAVGLDSLLFDICEALQLTPTQHQKAVDRYSAIARTLDGPDSPFNQIESNLYPQGSMRLGTTVKPIDGPHDLDFVCEFNVSHTSVNPMGLLNAMYRVFAEHGVYGGMVELKKRCVRIVYKDEFYLDILPACRDHGNGGTCIQVPDRDLRNWTPSNPITYATWFENATRHVLVSST